MLGVGGTISPTHPVAAGGTGTCVLNGDRKVNIPPSFRHRPAAARANRKKKKRVSMKQRFSSRLLPVWPWRWELPEQALSERVSGLADISADLLFLCRTLKEPHRLLLLSARSRQFNFLLAFHSANFFFFIYQDFGSQTLPGSRGGWVVCLRLSDYHMNLCLFFLNATRGGVLNKGPFKWICITS